MAGKEPSPGVIDRAYEYLVRCAYAKRGLVPIGLKIINTKTASPEELAEFEALQQKALQMLKEELTE